MSRVAKKPIPVPKGVDVEVDGQKVHCKGPQGSMHLQLHHSVAVDNGDAELNVSARHEKAQAMAGTMRALLNNCVIGVSEGFTRKLELRGVGYRAQAQGSTLNLSLGFSHPVHYELPEGVAVETPSQTEIVLRGIDKQKVGQAAANIRAFRPPEPYKGKGVRYSNERVVMKEAKKK